MSKNTQLGNLVNGLFVDSTGRVGVGNVSPTVALDVVGAGKFSGAVTASSLSSPEKVSTIFGINAATSSGNGGSLTIKAGNGSGAGNTSGSLYLGFGRGGVSASSGAMYFGVAQATDAVGLDATYMTLTSAGNVGIGTDSPFAGGNPAKLQVKPATNINLAIQIGTADATGIKLNAFNDAANANIPMELNGSIMILKTAETERMRILANGNVLIGNTTDSGDRLRVTGSIASNGTSAGIFFQNRVAGNFLGFYTDNNSTLIVYNTNVGNIATINQSNGNYTALSDINKKKDFEQSSVGLNEVLQLKPTLYRMKTDDESSSKELGFIAQEVKEIIPQAYSESGEGEKKFIGLNQMPLIAALTKAIQELSAEINILKQK